MIITGGVTLKDGLRVDGIEDTRPSFTLTSYTDFNDFGLGYGLEADVTGMNIGGTYGASQAFYSPRLGVPYGGNSAKSAEILAFWNANDLTLNGGTYMFDVEWGPGSSTNTAHNVALLKFTYYGENSTELFIGPVDTNITGWDTPGQNPFYDIKVANGTFLFPATFKLISPVIEDVDSWC